MWIPQIWVVKVNNEQLSARLADSGLILVCVEETVTSCPPSAAFAATGCGPDDGRVDIVVEYDSPDPLGDVNRAWYAQATRFGLFGDTGEFLLLVNMHDDPYDADLRWARVRLGPLWNVSGDRSTTINGPTLDGLITMSVHGDVIVEGSTGQRAMDVLAVPNPHKASAIRHYIGFMLRNGELSGLEADNVKNWLARA
ncbi:hypothetical protein ACFC58_31365 [Kitasatospora purpeofusca]|uniref:hypothetical protein n=1 Tax=Kitasatospora purpeofusca TaxID=67352 RepID=UPI0035D55805